ncbi:MAG TPA: hypothetical protein VFV68_05110 [Agriterribacter sp.]|nr:hypothetical protein [Agriterribacter sp.]
MEPRTFFSAIRASLFAIAISTVAISATANPVSVGDPLEKAAEVRYLGTDQESLIFNIKYDNVNASKFLVTIKDENGTTIFQDAFSEVNFNKRFLLKLETNKVVFILSDKTNRYTESFSISKEIRTVEDVEVKKLNQ